MSKKKLSPWNNNLKFIHSLKPETNFKSNDHPVKPDYSESSNWAAFPGIDGFQNLSPDNSLSLDEKEFDVFLFIQQGILKKIGIHQLIRQVQHLKEQAVT